VKETGSQRTVELHDGGHKGSVARGGLRRKGLKMFPEPPGKAVELCRSFCDEIGLDKGLMLHDECFDLAFESRKFGDAKSDLILARCLPRLATIECGGEEIRRKKRDLSEMEGSSGVHSGPKMGMVELLHRGATRNAQVRRYVLDLGNPFRDGFEGSRNAANRIVDGGRPVDRDNDLVDTSGDLRGFSVKKKASGEKRDSYVEIAEENAKRREIAMEKRFASRKNNLADTEADERFAMAFKVCDRQFL
jgi:hypothetical protein